MRLIATDNRPSDSDYALLSNHVYGGNELKINAQVKDAGNWVIKKIYDGPSEFFAVLYRHRITHHLVLAYRGTDSIQAIIEDLHGIYNDNSVSPQRKKAYGVVRDAIAIAEEGSLPLSFTGHSLGAYLAELSVFYCHAYSCKAVTATDDNDDNNDNDYDVRTSVHAVTFESPGTLDAMDKLQSHLPNNALVLHQLDITTYMSYPNLVNTLNRQVGTIYSLKPKIDGWSNVPGWHLKQVHSMSHIVEAFTNAKALQPTRHYMRDWPHGNQRSHFFKQVTLKNGQYHWTKPLEELANQAKFTLQGHYRWDEQLSNWSTLPLRHFALPLQDWLLKFYDVFIKCSHNHAFMAQVKAKWSEIGMPEPMTDLLCASALLMGTLRQNDVYLNVVSSNPEHTAAHCRKTISRWLSENADKAREILTAAEAVSQLPDIQATLLAPGSILGETGYIESPVIRGVQVIIPHDVHPQMLEHFKQVSQHFLSTLKATGTKISVVGIAPGAQVHGKISNLSLTAVEFRVGALPEPSDNARLGSVPINHAAEGMQSQGLYSTNSTARSAAQTDDVKRRAKDTAQSTNESLTTIGSLP